MEQLQQLVQTLADQHTQKRDYVVPAHHLHMDSGRILIGQGHVPLHQHQIYDPTTVMHESLSEKLQIPLAYYRRMQSQRPELLDYTVSDWLQSMAGKNVLLRTFEGVEKNVARALLSDRYQAIDNYDLLFAALEAIKGMGVKVEIKNADVTDRRLYLNVVAPEIEIQATEALKGYLTTRQGAGNGVISGFTISNSEVGQGSFQIRPRAVILKCNNGLICSDDNFSRVHLGGKLEAGTIQWSSETTKRNLQLVMSQIRDAIKTFLSSDYLGKMVAKIEQAHAIKLEHPIDAVQNACKALSYTEEQRKSILESFMLGGDFQGSGISHAITQHAQKEDPDTRNDMEVAAFNILPKVQEFDKPFSGN